MAVAEKTLLEFLMDLLSNKEALADFRHDPEAALQHAGLGDCSVQDIKELLPVVLEKVDAEKCAQYEDDCDDDKCYDSEPKHHDDDHHCKPVDCDDEGRPAPHCSPIEQSIAHLNYVTNNYNFVDNSHDTYNTTNNITKIWAGDGSHVNVENTTTNVGDGATYVGHDNYAPITHGDGNVVGDGNQVSGAHSTTAFGSGAATTTGDLDAGDHGAVNVGPGSALVNDASLTDSGNTDNSLHDVGNTDVKVHDAFNSHAEDNSDHSVHTNTEDDHSQTVDHGAIDNSSGLQFPDLVN